MAIDTEAKRRAAPRWVPGMPGMPPGPKPDGTISEEDRRHIAGVYPGIAPDAPAPETAAPVMGQRPWLSEVLAADKAFYKTKDPAYEFSNGRKFNSTDHTDSGIYD